MERHLPNSQREEGYIREREQHMQRQSVENGRATEEHQKTISTVPGQATATATPF